MEYTHERFVTASGSELAALQACLLFAQALPSEFTEKTMTQLTECDEEHIIMALSIAANHRRCDFAGMFAALLAHASWGVRLAALRALAALSILRHEDIVAIEKYRREFPDEISAVEVSELIAKGPQ